MPIDITDGCSIEVTAAGMSALAAAAPRLAPGTTISIPCLLNEDREARLAALRAVRRLGFEPMPHVSARRVASIVELQSFLDRAVVEARVDRCLVIAGDASVATGPFADSASLIDTGIFERLGIRLLGVGAHPQDHSIMSPAERWQVLERKCRSIVRRGMTPSIVTQFVFDADIVLNWLKSLRERGIDHPVRVGVPGPAGVVVLARYAALCGVSACALMGSAHGLSIGKLLGTAGPDLFVERLTAGLTEAHGPVSLHFYPFGGVARSVGWIEQHRSGTGRTTPASQ